MNPDAAYVELAEAKKAVRVRNEVIPAMGKGPHPDDCLGCAVNRIIRRLAKEAEPHMRDVEDRAAFLRRFGRAVAHDVQKEVERRHAES